MFLWYSSILGYISSILASSRQLYKAQQHLLIFIYKMATFNNLHSNFLVVCAFMLDYLSMLTTSSRMLGVLQSWVGAFKRRWNLGQIEGRFMIGCLGGQICCWKWSFLHRASRAKIHLGQRSGRSKCKMLANFVKICVICHVRKVRSLRVSSNMWPVCLLIHV